MKKYLSFLLVFLLTACGSAATPTLNAMDVQGTAVANAWLIVTLTQYAMPTATATLAPPTALPTLMATPLPTLPPLQPTATMGVPTADPCNDVPPAEPKGTTVQVRFINKSKGSVSVFAFGMNTPNSLGECGTYNFALPKFGEITLKVLAGCYWAWASIDTPSNAKNVQILCVTDTVNGANIIISDEVINFP